MNDLWPKILRYIYSRKTLIMYEYSMSALAASVLEAGDGFVFRELQPGEWGRMEEVLVAQGVVETVFRPGFGPAEVRKRLQGGNYCFVCENKERIVGYTWFAADKKYIMEVQSTIRLKKHQLYAFNAYVTRKCRGNNIFRNLLITGARVLYLRGFTGGVAASMVWNTASRAILPRVAFLETGRVNVGYLFTIRYMTNTCSGISLEGTLNPFDFYKKLFRKLSRLYHVRGPHRV